MFTGRLAASLLLAGWLAEQLAARDRDVERGVAAYAASDFETALAAFDAAIVRRGDRPELQYDRGLVLLAQDDREGAKTSFERASEADDMNVRASAHYELGNLALDAETWDEAVTHYIECLKAKPDHGNAKWNLELALERKRAEEEQKKKEEEQKKEEQEKEEGSEQEDEPQDTEGEPNPDEGEPKDEESPSDPDEKKGEEEEPQPPEEPKSDETKEEPQPQDGEKPQQEPQSEDAQTAPAPIQQMDIDKALDQLDQQDALMLDRPSGRIAQPEKDW